YRDWFGRPVVSALPEDAIVDGLTRAAEGGLRTALLAGDLRGLGRRRAMRLLDRLAALELPLVLQIELFFMADYIEAFTRATRNGGLRLTLSPESASRKVRAIVSRGKDYSNEQIKDLARIHQDLGAMFLLCMFFALPHQTADQVRRDSDFIAEVLEIAPTSTGFMQEPMLFVDPGSPIYRDPGHFGYTIHARTLSDLKTHLTRPYWTGAIGFETQWMSRRELIESVFSVFERTTELHYRHAHADASQFLFTRGAVAAHRAVVTALEQEGDLYVTGEGADALVDRLIEEHVPEVHRGDNNLKDYAGHEAARRGGRLMHALFPGTTDLLLGRAADPTELAAAFEAGADALDTLLELRHPMTELPRSIARPLRAIADRVTPPLPPRVVVDLAAFELACCRLATPSSRAPMEQIAAGIHRTQPMDDFVTGIEEMHDEMQRPPLDRGLSETSPSSLREPDGGTALEPALRTHSLRADDRVRLQPQAAILTTRYPVHQLAQTDLGDVLEREGTFVIAVSRGGVALYEQEAATLLQALCKGPRQPTRAIPGDPGPRGLRLLEVFLNRLADRGVIESAG
ncbi:MAG: radical SAM protein, partial [Planctomycetota bacterium]